MCDADIVYLHLEAVPVGPAWFEKALVSSGTPFVYDVDDLVHAIRPACRLEPNDEQLGGPFRRQRVVDQRDRRRRARFVTVRPADTPERAQTHRLVEPRVGRG